MVSQRSACRPSEGPWTPLAQLDDDGYSGGSTAPDLRTVVWDRGVRGVGAFDARRKPVGSFLSLALTYWSFFLSSTSTTSWSHFRQLKDRGSIQSNNPRAALASSEWVIREADLGAPQLNG